MAKEPYEEMFERIGEEDVRRGVEGKLGWHSRRKRAGQRHLNDKEREREAKLKRALMGEPSVKGLTPAPVVEPSKFKKFGLIPDKSPPAQEPGSIADRVRKAVLGDKPRAGASLPDLLQEHELNRVREEKREKKWDADVKRLALIFAALAVIVPILIAVFSSE